MHYTMKDAKRDFSMGYLGQFSLERNILGGGWRVKVGPKENKALHPLVDARSHEWRLFKTLDAAVAALVDIGFAVDYLGV